MIAKYAVDWVEKKKKEALDEEDLAKGCVKAAKAGAVEGMIDGAIIAGLFYAALGLALTVHDSLHKLTGR